MRHVTSLAAQLDAFREQLVSLVELQNECAMHQQALQAVSQQYRPQGMEATDFKAVIDAKRQELLAAQA